MLLKHHPMRNVKKVKVAALPSENQALAYIFFCNYTWLWEKFSL